MIFTDRTITVRKGESRIDEPIVVYRGDYELEVRFTILNSRFKFMSGTNMIESEKASYGQLAILTPYGGNIFSDIVRCNDGSVTFVLTAEMLNQIEEVGLYSFQIRLMDYMKESRVSIPPIEFGIEVREPIASEDHDNSVNNAIVGYSIAKVVDPKEEKIVDTFDESGNYNKTKWETGDRISEGKLNKIEDAIDKINENEVNNTAVLSRRIDNNFNVLDSIKANVNEVVKKGYGTLNDFDEETRRIIQGLSESEIQINAVLGAENVQTEHLVDGCVSLDKISNLVFQKKLLSLGSNITYTGLRENTAYRGWCNPVKLDGKSFDSIKTVTNVSQDTTLYCDILNQDLTVLFSTSKNVLQGEEQEVVFNFNREISIAEEFYVSIYAPTNTINVSHCVGSTSTLNGTLEHYGLLKTRTGQTYISHGQKVYVYLEFFQSVFESKNLIVPEKSVGFEQIKENVFNFQESSHSFKTYTSKVLKENNAYRGWAIALKACFLKKITVYSNISTDTEVTCSILDKTFTNIVQETSTFVSSGTDVQIDFEFEETVRNNDSFYLCITSKANTSTFSYNYAGIDSTYIDETLTPKGILKTSSSITKNPVDLSGYNMAVDIYPTKVTFPLLQISKAQITDLDSTDIGNSQTSTKRKIIFPTTIPVVEGNEMNYFYDNAILNDTINSLKRVTCSKNYTSNWTQLDRYTYTPNSDMNSADLSFYHYFENTVDIDHVVSANFVIVPKDVGTGLTKKVMFLGDSITADGRYEKELLNLFSNDKMSVELIGKRGSSPTFHEGRGGWTSKHYCTQSKLNNVANLFWNPDTSKFDFNYYMTKQGYDGLDYFFLMLGTNDLANPNSETMSYFEEIISSVLSYDSNITIVVNLFPPLSSRVDRFSLKNKRLELFELLLDKYDKRQSEKIFVMPTYLNIDPLWDFPYEEINDSRHVNWINITDNTHPNDSGYNKIADVIYYMIKYIASRE